MLSDLRFAFRQFVKAPGFTAVIVVTLGLGIAACTIVFSTVSDVLLKSTDILDVDHLVLLRATHPPDVPESRVSVADFLDWQAQAKSFDGLFATGGRRLNYTGGVEPLPLIGRAETADFRRLSGITPLLGRWFLPAECEPGSDRVVVLTEGLWQRLFAGSPDVLGRTMQLNGEPYAIVGVTRWPRWWLSQDLVLPFTFTAAQRADRKTRTSSVMGRLKPGVTLAQAQAELDVIAAGLAQRYPDTNRGWGARVTPLRDAMVGNVRGGLWTLFGAVGGVLLLACANIANLLLMRATARQHEMSIRAAVGGSRSRLVRQLLTESVLLALLGGAAGVLLAQWGLEVVRLRLPAQIPLLGGDLRLDTPLLGFALALSLATGILFGLAPSWFVSRVDLQSALRQGTRGATEGGARGRWRKALVVVQVAGALVLLTGAGLLVRSFVRLANVDPGFVPEHAIGVQIFASQQRYAKPEQRVRFADDVLARMRTLPGVQAAGAVLQLPIGDSSPLTVGFDIAGRPPAPDGHRASTIYYTASPDYFRAAGMRVLRGRAFAATDDARAPRVAIINETFAKRYFAGDDPIGRRIKLAMTYDGWREIVGVVSDVKEAGLDRDTLCQVYEPNTQGQYPGTSFVVRFTGDPTALIPLLKQQVYAVDKYQPVQTAVPLEDLVSGNIAVPRFATQLLTMFSFLALVIAAVGIYGVMAYSVSQRTAEIGIRMALGASQSNVLRQVLTQGLKLVGAGLLIGLVAALAAGRLIQSQLFRTSSYDPVALTLVAVFLAAVGLFACWLPARRATRINPVEALRAE
jgi:putative ABC transport system permease protein